MRVEGDGLDVPSIHIRGKHSITKLVLKDNYEGLGWVVNQI